MDSLERGSTSDRCGFEMEALGGLKQEIQAHEAKYRPLEQPATPVESRATSIKRYFNAIFSNLQGSNHYQPITW